MQFNTSNGHNLKKLFTTTGQAQIQKAEKRAEYVGKALIHGVTKFSTGTNWRLP